MTLPISVLWLALAGPSGSSCSDAPLIADVPRASYQPTAASRRRGPDLRRSYDLQRAFTLGEGTLHSSGQPVAPPSPVPDLALHALPWFTAGDRVAASRLIGWRGPTRHVDSDGMVGFVLAKGQTWCTPEWTLAPGTRLRFESLAVEASPPTRLEVQRRAASTTRTVWAGHPGAPAVLDTGSQRDLPLEPGPASLCFRATGGAVAVGEPRLLAPEPPGSDSRPRWVVVVVVDALRGDALDGPLAQRNNPALLALARGGHVYSGAVSGGCHTQAGVWPALMGRDLMRIDPTRRRSFTWNAQAYLPLETVYSRPNLFVSHLAREAGYHTVLLGNNAFMDAMPAFERYSIQGRRDMGTVDTMARLPALFGRYADERLMLLYYVSTPHNSSFTPRRIYDEFGCAGVKGVDECRCRYGARIRHADESVAALQEALSDHGLAGRTLQVITSDHGEAFGDTIRLEADASGKWERVDMYHGFTCQWAEVHVPLVVAGQGIQAGKTSSPVSALDIVPTLVHVLGLPPVHRMDGERLPSSGGHGARGRPLVSYGFCSHSVVQDGQQFIWWQGDCGSRRELDGGALLHHVAEVWSGGTRLATDLTSRDSMRHALRGHERWMADRLPSDAVIVDASAVPQGTFTATALEGRIVDFGPSATVYGLAGLRSATLAASGQRLTVRWNGYPGLYYLATSPPRTPVKIEAVGGDGTPILVALGPLQLPIELRDRPLDPREHPAYFFADGRPDARPLTRPALRVWWQAPPTRAAERGREALLDFGRVLREWGYIR